MLYEKEIGIIMSDIETSIDENLLGFITGSISLDTYDSFIQGLHSMGVDDAVAIYQDALDAYLANEWADSIPRTNTSGGIALRSLNGPRGAGQIDPAFFQHPTPNLNRR